MSFGGLILTNGGRNELAMAETGKQFHIESVVFRDGTYNGSYMSITSLVNQVMVSEAQITRKYDEVYVDLEFSSNEVPKAFFLREIGIIANGTLCYYDNCGQEAEYIDPESDSIIKQKRMRFILKIASEVSVNTTIDWQMYAKEKDLQALTDAVLNQTAIEDAFKTVYPEIAITTAANPKKIGIEGLLGVWKKAYSLMKLVTGSADADDKGSLQEQINSLDNKKADKTGDLASAKVTYTEAGSLTPLASGEKMSTAFGKLAKLASAAISHFGSKSNPHQVTKAQVGLGNAENKSSATIRSEITKQNVTVALGYTPLDAALKGTKNGVAELDATGRVPSAQLPIYCL